MRALVPAETPARIFRISDKEKEEGILGGLHQRPEPRIPKNLFKN
jgi:hypothetical protein